MMQMKKIAKKIIYINQINKIAYKLINKSIKSINNLIIKIRNIIKINKNMINKNSEKKTQQYNYKQIFKKLLIKIIMKMLNNINFNK